MKNVNVFVMTVTSILFTAFSTFKYQKVTHCALETDMFRFQVYKNNKIQFKIHEKPKDLFVHYWYGNTGPVFTWYKISANIYRTTQH